MKSVTALAPWVLGGCVLLGGCASTGGDDAALAPDLADAEVAVRTEDNGDVIEEYRVANQLRMVKITPARGPAYYLMDDDGDGRMDNRRGNGEPSPVYWKLYGW